MAKRLDLKSQMTFREIQDRGAVRKSEEVKTIRGEIQGKRCVFANANETQKEEMN